MSATAPNSDWPYRFAVVPLGEMFTATYQRKLTRLAKKIEEHYDPALVGTLVLSQRDNGRYAIIDGQQRWHGMSARELREAPAVVFMGLTLADEAMLFARLQKERQGMASFERFRAALIGKDPEALAIRAIVREAGYDVGQDGQQPDEIRAVAALEKVYRQAPELLERVLTILKETYEPPPSAELIRGLGVWLRQSPGVDDEKVAARLARVTLDQLKGKALAAREVSSSIANADTYMAQAIEAVYMQGKD